MECAIDFFFNMSSIPLSMENEFKMYELQLVMQPLAVHIM